MEITRNKRLHRVLSISFVFNCIFSSIALKDVFSIVGGEKPSILDVLAFPFNVYSYVCLLFLPMYIYSAYFYLRPSLSNEFLITRFRNRKEFFKWRLKEVFKFAVIYRIFEVFIVFLIFIFSGFQNSAREMHFSPFSAPIKKVLCVYSKTPTEDIVILLCIHIILLLVYISIALAIIAYENRTRSQLLAAILPMLLDFIILAMIKDDYLFSGCAAYFILPHSNLFLEFMSARSCANYSKRRVIFALLYWALIVEIQGILIYFKMQWKNYINMGNNGDQN